MDMGTDWAISAALWVDATKVRYRGKATITTPRISTRWDRTVRPGRFSIMEPAQYWTFFSTKRNCTTVSATTISIKMTDCAAEPPMSSALKPS